MNRTDLDATIRSRQLESSVEGKEPTASSNRQVLMRWNRMRTVTISRDVQERIFVRNRQSEIVECVCLCVVFLR